MASLRNSIPRRTHKERSQPADRKRYGLLEKHKDYVLRARDYHKKEDAIRKLREKAAFRNPDEFYFKMQNSVTKDGVHQARVAEPNKYTPEELLLMKTQDIRYILNKAQAEAKKVEKLQAALHSIGQTPVNKHVIFADDSREAEEDVGPSTSAQPEQPEMLASLPKRLQKKRNAAYRELEERADRAKKMARIVQKMALQKELMGKGRKRKMKQAELEEPGKGTVYKWKRERKQ